MMIAGSDQVLKLWKKM